MGRPDSKTPIRLGRNVNDRSTPGGSSGRTNTAGNRNASIGAASGNSLTRSSDQRGVPGPTSLQQQYHPQRHHHAIPIAPPDYAPPDQPANDPKERQREVGAEFRGRENHCREQLVEVLKDIYAKRHQQLPEKPQYRLMYFAAEELKRYKEEHDRQSAPALGPLQNAQLEEELHQCKQQLHEKEAAILELLAKNAILEASLQELNAPTTMTALGHNFGMYVPDYYPIAHTMDGAKARNEMDWDPADFDNIAN